MARTHEIAIGIPRELHDQISKYLELDFVKKQGLTSKRQFVISCIRMGFDYFDNPDSQLHKVPQVNTNTLMEFFKQFNEKEDKIKKLEKKIDELNVNYKKSGNKEELESRIKSLETRLSEIDAIQMDKKKSKKKTS